MSLEIKTLPAMRLAAVRHGGPYHLIGPAFHRLSEIAGPAGLFAKPGAAKPGGMMVGLYKDDPRTTAPESLRSAAGVVIAEDTAVPEGLVEERVAGGRFACLMHLGPYEQLANSWMRLGGELIPAGGHRRRSEASYEIYFNTPEQVRASELRTQICVPIE